MHHTNIILLATPNDPTAFWWRPVFPRFRQTEDSSVLLSRSVGFLTRSKPRAGNTHTQKQEEHHQSQHNTPSHSYCTVTVNSTQLIHSFIHSRTRIILPYNREFINLSSTAARQYSRWLHQWPFSLSLSLSFSSPANKHRFLLLVVAAQKRNWFDPKKRTSRSRIIILD